MCRFARTSALLRLLLRASSGDLINRYVAALVRELELVAADLSPTPSSLAAARPPCSTCANGNKSSGPWNVSNARRGGMDRRMQPGHRLGRQGQAAPRPGVNRISMGVQSLDETLLDRLGRIHSREMVFKSFDVLRQAGFDNVNLDLMFAIPGQTLDIWRETLWEAIALGSEHLVQLRSHLRGGHAPV